MEAKEFLKLVTDKTEAGDLIKENNLTEAVIKMLDNYSEIRVKNCSIPDVSNRRELYFAFMKEYNSLMGESEHQILREEVEVLLAKYSC